MDITTETIDTFLKAYSAAWARNDAAAIQSFWDTDDMPFYLAEEIDTVYNTWSQVQKYWQHNEGFHDAISLVFSDIHLKPLRGGDVMAAMRLRWDIAFRQAEGAPDSVMPDIGNLMGGDNHVIAVVRAVQDDIKLTAWIEAPMAPITYMKQLYAKDITPGFPPAS